MPCVLQKTVSIQRQHKFSRFARMMKLMWNEQPKGDDSGSCRIRTWVITTLFASGHPSQHHSECQMSSWNSWKDGGRSFLGCGQGSLILGGRHGKEIFHCFQTCQIQVWVLSTDRVGEREESFLILDSLKCQWCSCGSWRLKNTLRGLCAFCSCHRAARSRLMLEILPYFFWGAGVNQLSRAGWHVSC